MKVSILQAFAQVDEFGFLPLLALLGLLLRVVVIYRSSYRRMEKLYMENGIEIPFPEKDAMVSDSWFPFYPHPDDPKDLAASKRNLIKEVQKQILVSVGISVIFGIILLAIVAMRG